MRTRTSKLPFLYLIAEGIIYPLMRYVVRYRLKVVRKNLRLAFPDDNKQALRTKEKQFYHWFADLLVEILASRTMSPEEMLERSNVIGLDKCYDTIRQKGGALMILGHLGCWEWLADIGNRCPEDIHTHVIYRKQKNPRVDRFMYELRSRRGCNPIDKNLLLRHMVLNKRSGDAHIYYLISDQKPSAHDLDHWVTFLHQETPFITGTETLAKKFDYPVWYVDVRMPSRGHYEARFVPISLEPKTAPDGYITDTFARLLEQNILENPAIWLWSHNRFKWTKQPAQETPAQEQPAKEKEV